MHVYASHQARSALLMVSWYDRLFMGPPFSATGLGSRNEGHRGNEADVCHHIILLIRTERQHGAFPLQQPLANVFVAKLPLTGWSTPQQDVFHYVLCTCIGLGSAERCNVLIKSAALLLYTIYTIVCHVGIAIHPCPTAVPDAHLGRSTAAEMLSCSTGVSSLPWRRSCWLE